MTSQGETLLLTPYKLRNITIPNRIILSPMVQYHAKDGIPGDYHLVHLGQFALGKFGVVMTEATAVEARGRITHECTGIWSDKHIAAWRRITRFIREYNSVPGIQLAHSGWKGSTTASYSGGLPYTTDQSWKIVGPSALAYKEGYQVPHELTVEEIKNIVNMFSAAAKRADDADFDILEIHGAHGYLLGSFLSSTSNKRTDEYGGNREARMKFPLEVCRAVRAAWPERKPLFFRISSIDGSNGWDIIDTVAMAKELKRCGIDVIDCSSGGIGTSITSGDTKQSYGYQVKYAAEVRNKAEIATIAVGLIMDAKHAECILQSGHADLIAIGRQALDDPHWPLHAANILQGDRGYRYWPKQYGYWLQKRAVYLKDN